MLSIVAQRLVKSLKLLTRDCDGFVLSTEIILVCSVAVIGLVGGLTVLKSGIATELSAVAQEFKDARRSVLQDDHHALPELQVEADSVAEARYCTEMITPE